MLSYLISEGLALELSSYPEHELYAFSAFLMDVTLTKKGLQEYERVVEAVFQYAQIVRDKGVQEYVFEECKRVGELNFDFADKSDPIDWVVTMSSKMQLFEGEKMEHIIRHQYGAWELDKERI